MAHTRNCPELCFRFAKSALFAAATLLAACVSSSSIAQEIEIGSPKIQVEIAPHTFTDGLPLELGTNSVAIELRATGVVLPLTEQCETFSDMRDEGVIEGRAALRFPPVRPRPRLAYVLRAVTPGWNERWEKAFSLMDLPDNTRLSAASEDRRPDVVGVSVEIEVDEDDAVLQEAFGRFQAEVNEALYFNRARLRNPGLVSIGIESILVACALLNSDVQFSVRHLLKGPNFISETIAFDGKLDDGAVQRAEDAIHTDNFPSGAVNRQLPLVIFVRLIQSLDANSVEIPLEEISMLESLATRWSGIVNAEFRELTRAERAELLSFLIDEDLRGMYLEHTDTTTIEVKLTDQ